MNAAAELPRPARLAARNPLTGLEDYSFDVASRADVQAACAAVRQAQPEWAALGVAGRIAVLQRLSTSFEQHQAELIAAIAADTGRRRIAAIEFAGVQGMIAANCALAPVVFSDAAERASMIPGIVGRRQLVAYPVVGVIAPWNFPLILSMIDAIPALVAGCAVVLKPSEVTPRYVDPLRKIFAAVPELDRVFRVVRGPGATGADVIDGVDAIVCTGSVRTGRIVAEHAARRFIPAFLELGGKDPAIVTADADLDRASTAVVRASVLATGQACQSLERVYVDQRVYADFVRRVVAKVQPITLTCHESNGHIGPFIMGRQADIVKDHIDDAIARGAKLEIGGHLVEQGGRWCEPTVLSGVTHAMRVMKEETFGPVIPIMPYRTLDEAITLANDGEYGLSANVFAGSESDAQAIAERLEAGLVSIGDASMSSFVMDFEWEGFRLSGLGRARIGVSGIARYLRVKAIVTNRGPAAGVMDARDE